MRIGLRDIIPVLYSGLYFVLAGGVIALAVLAFREDVPPYARDPPCFLPLRKMAVFLYRKRERKVRVKSEKFRVAIYRLTLTASICKCWHSPLHSG